MEKETNSAFNTVLIVLLIIVVLFIGAWLTRGYWSQPAVAPAAEENGGSLNIDVNLPEGNGQGQEGGEEVR